MFGQTYASPNVVPDNPVSVPAWTAHAGLYFVQYRPGPIGRQWRLTGADVRKVSGWFRAT